MLKLTHWEFLQWLMRSMVYVVQSKIIKLVCLAKNGCIEDLAKKIVEVLKNKRTLENLSKEALDYSRGFSWDKTATEFMSVVEKCVADTKIVNK